LQIAHAAAAGARCRNNAESHGICIGEKVVVAATDTGTDPIEGVLYAATKDRISIARQDPRAGKVVVHFPRLDLNCGATTNLKCAAPKNAKPKTAQKGKVVVSKPRVIRQLFQFAGVARRR